MNNYAKSCFALPDGFSKVFVVSIHKLIDIVPEPGLEHTVYTENIPHHRFGHV